MHPQFTKMTILVVDDYANIRSMVCSHLRQLKHEGTVLNAENVDEAIALMEKSFNTGKPIDLIISDWNMPGKSGLDYLLWIRDHSKYKNIPFLLLTTVNEMDKVIKAVSHGVSNYLIKPWTLADLKKKIESSLEKHLNN